MADDELGVSALGCRELVNLDVFCQQILQSAAYDSLFARVGAAIAPVAPAVEIETETPRYHDKPSGQLAARIDGKFPQSPAVVRAELFEHERVRIHSLVVAFKDRARNMEEQPRMLGGEAAPRRVELTGIAGSARVEKPIERTRKRRHNVRDHAAGQGERVTRLKMRIDPTKSMTYWTSYGDSRQRTAS